MRVAHIPSEVFYEPKYVAAIYELQRPVEVDVESVDRERALFVDHIG